MSSVGQAIMTTDIKEVPLYARGKVRDVYDLGDRLLFVATDRISAFDVVFNEPIPDKGRVLTGLSVFWFDYTKEIARNHVISTDVSDLPDSLRKYEEMLAQRFMIVAKGKVMPVECIIRGYISGSAWKQYQIDGTVNGIRLPRGLQNGSKLPEPLFTPTTKATEGHDMPITIDQMAEMVGRKTTDEVMEKSLALYAAASARAEERGIILADTKLEFAVIDGELCVADEVFTPDSSRFWPMDEYRPGGSQPSFDKQYLRDYLETLDWDQAPPPPALPAEVIAKTREKYLEAYERIVGKPLL